MLKKHTFIITALLFNATISFANYNLDSIGVENYNGKKLIIHKVEAKETYYSIARKYNVLPKTILSYNDNLALQIGVIIKVPTDVAFNSKANTEPEIVKEHVIKPKENLNLLASKYATTVDELKKLNNLSSNNLQIGQVLKIPNTTTVLQNEVKTIENKTDSKPPLKEKTYVPTPIVNNEKAENLGEHVVKTGETIYAIAKKYDLTTYQIKTLNSLTSNELVVGQLLKIPNTSIAKEYKAAEKTYVPTPVVKNEKAENFGEHVVKTGETIYAIAKKYDLTTYQIKTANNLTSNELVVGQKLIIKQNNLLNNSNNNTTDSVNTIKDPSLKYPPSRYGLNLIEEKGTAVWITDVDLDPTKMLVLHRTVSIGTVVKITNPMSNRSILAKVVGKFTENETTKDVIIVMTKAVADALGALDKRFFCNLTYAIQEHE